MTIKRIILALAVLVALVAPAHAQQYYQFGAVVVGSNSSNVRVGPFGCYVNTADPTYVNAKIYACSLTTTGRLRVDPGSAAAALADNVANPTVPSFGAYLLCWDGATWDRCAAADGGIGTVSSATDRVVPAQTTAYKSIDLDESEEEVQATPGEVCSIIATNTSTGTRFLKFYNDTAANVIVGTTVPLFTIALPGNASDDVLTPIVFGSGCLKFSVAITMAATTGVGDGDSGAPAANDVVLVVGVR